MASAVTVETFDQEVLQSPLPVLVDFWAEWCGPCRMLSPIIDELAKHYDGKVKICKLNVDEAADIAARYGVMSIPTLILFNKGQVVTQTVGAQTKDKIKSMVEAELAH